MNLSPSTFHTGSHIILYFSHFFRLLPAFDVQDTSTVKLYVSVHQLCVCVFNEGYRSHDAMPHVRTKFTHVQKLVDRPVVPVLW